MANSIEVKEISIFFIRQNQSFLFFCYRINHRSATILFDSVRCTYASKLHVTPQ